MSGNKYNVVFLFIDALRYDAISQQSTGNELTPTINKLHSKGVLQKITTNGQVTKFAVPSIFTQTYPLDYGGYNTGIKNRPASFIEIFRDAGYSCHMYEGHDIDGPFGCCERGFDSVNIYHDKRLALEGFLKKKILYDIGQWRLGVYDDNRIIDIVQSEFDKLLKHMEVSDSRTEDKSLWPTLGLYRKSEIKRIQKERALLKDEPMHVIKKIESIPPYFYYYYLGVIKADISLKFRNKAISIFKNIEKRINAYFNTELSFVPSRPRVPPLCSKIFKDAVNAIEKIKEPWLVYIHVMDLHDHSMIMRPLNLLAKLLHLPKVLRYRKKIRESGVALTRKLTYDLTLSYVDSQLEKLMNRINHMSFSNETLFVLIGDHGAGWDYARDESLRRDFGFRTHYEHIAVPLIISPLEKNKSGKGLFDSMSISASLLDVTNINGHPSFKGKSVFSTGLDAVVTENCGRGNADIKNRDIYFTITNSDYKLFVVLRESEIIIERLYDIKNEPRELTNIVEQPEKISIIDSLLEHLFEERGELLELRGISFMPQVSNQSASIRSKET